MANHSCQPQKANFSNKDVKHLTPRMKQNLHLHPRTETSTLSVNIVLAGFLQIFDVKSGTSFIFEKTAPNITAFKNSFQEDLL